MKGIFQPAVGLPGYESIKARVLGRESVLVSGIGSVVQDYLSAALAEDLDRPIVIVTANELSARQAMENMAFYAPEKVVFFPNSGWISRCACLTGGSAV